MESLQVVWLALLAMGISWIEERVGKFETLSPSVKQFINAGATLVVPVFVAWSAGWWAPAFGSAEGFFNNLIQLLAPAGIWLGSWLASQGWHYIDKGLAKVTK